MNAYKKIIIYHIQVHFSNIHTKFKTFTVNMQSLFGILKADIETVEFGYFNQWNKKTDLSVEILTTNLIS